MGVPPITVDVVRSDDVAWDRWLELAVHDVYHLRSYHAWSRVVATEEAEAEEAAGRAGAGPAPAPTAATAGGPPGPVATSGSAASEGGEPYLVVVGDRTRGVAWPYLLRRTDVAGASGVADSCDVTSAYGYPGPVAWGCRRGDPFVDEAWAAIRAVWREQGAVSAFTRFHPLLGNASLLESLVPGPGEGDGVVTVGPTVSLDCTVDDETARAEYSRAVRQQVRQALRAGLVFEHDDDWSHLAAFARIYHETMTRNAAAASFFFSEDDFRRLRDALGSHLHLVAVHKDGAVASAGLFTELGGIVQLHLVGTDPEHLPSSPQKVLVDGARTWAAERGNRVLHLGGGRGGREDSLFTFKSRFSDRRHAFKIGRWILRPGPYAELVAAHRAALADRAVIDAGFFPAYRAPLRHPEPADEAAAGD